jgi:hypothetical protein
MFGSLGWGLAIFIVATILGKIDLFIFYCIFFSLPTRSI